MANRGSVKVEGGMNPGFLQVVGKARPVTNILKEKSDKIKRIADAKARRRGQGFRYFYGTRHMKGLMNDTILIWASNQWTLDHPEVLKAAAAAGGVKFKGIKGG